ncbi:MAG TPA: class II fumarate hydratase [Verrucomicrobiae bacterium]
MNREFRTESDSMGDIQVPADAYYGAQTARAAENFPISNRRFSREFIHTLGLIKKHAAVANAVLDRVPKDIAHAIEAAATEVADGKWDTQFIVDVFQTGSGTSTNMNANEVIANRATELSGGVRGEKLVHPNDHVNCGQSSNDVIPTAIQVTALDGVIRRLIPSLGELRLALEEKARQFDPVLKIGRTHLQDGTPMRLGQEFSGYASQISHDITYLRQAARRLGDLPLGGTAVGTGLNTHPQFSSRVIAGLAQELKLNLQEAANHFEAQGHIGALIETSGALKSVAVNLIKIANDVRWLGSGPRCGLGELRLPALQPGSSIMPGKVNPVMCEMVIQVGAQVIGNDAVVTFAGTFGNFELNTMLPVAAYNLLDAIELLANASAMYARRCINGLEADVKKCERNIENSLAMCTSLVPAIGYDQAAKIAKTAYETGKTVREVAVKMSGLDKNKLDELLNARRQTGPEAN